MASDIKDIAFLWAEGRADETQGPLPPSTAGGEAISGGLTIYTRRLICAGFIEFKYYFTTKRRMTTTMAKKDSSIFWECAAHAQA